MAETPVELTDLPTYVSNVSHAPETNGSVEDLTVVIPSKRKVRFPEEVTETRIFDTEEYDDEEGSIQSHRPEDEPQIVHRTTLFSKLKIFRSWKQNPKTDSSGHVIMTSKLQKYMRDHETKQLKKLEKTKRSLAKDWDKYLKKSFRYIPPNFVIPEYRRKEVHEIDDLFGYRSELNESLKTLFGENSSEEPIDTISNVAEESQIELKESSSERDMSWLRNLSPSEENMDSRNRDSDERGNIKNSFAIFWTFLRIGARMPFVFVKNNNPRIASECKFDKKRLTFSAFLISSIFLLIVATLALVSFIAIFFGDEDIQKPFIQTEKLLFYQQWVTGAVFLGTLFMASISSFSVLVSGHEMANFITEWGQVLTELNFDSTTGIWFITTIFILWSCLQGVLELIIFFTSENLNSFIEGTHFIAILIFRHYDPEVVFSPHIKEFAIFAMFLNIYAVYCSRNFILLVIVYSVGIENLASEWNLRLRLLLRQISGRENESKLLTVFQSCTYQKMFDQHQKIVKLVKQISEAFGVILISFYITQGIVIASELLEVAVHLVGNETNPFVSDTPDTVIYQYDKDSHDRWYNFVHITQTILIFCIVSFYLSSAGYVIMEGLTTIRRHGLLSIASTHHRNFILSLQMSFSEKQPHFVNVKGLFNVDRSFMLAFFAGTLYFFSVMIQTNFPRLLNIPILFDCSVVRPGRLCIETVPTTSDNVVQLLELSFANIINFNAENPAQYPCTIPGHNLTSERYKCAGAEVLRYHVYNDLGRRMQSQTNKTFDCIYHPYPREKGPYFDCFGNLLNVYDDCGMLGFGSSFGLQPPIAVRTIYADAAVFRYSVGCFNLNATIYAPEASLGELWSTCGLPKWFVGGVCKRGKNAQPPEPVEPTLESFQRHVTNFNNFPSGTALSCPTPTTMNSTFETIFELYRRDNFQLSFTLFPIPSELWRRYFPLFHPRLQGSQLNNTFAFACAGRQSIQVPLRHDSCGGLDFSSNGTMEELAPGSEFLCFSRNFCNITICEGWKAWFQENQPIF